MNTNLVARKNYYHPFVSKKEAIEAALDIAISVADRSAADGNNYREKYYVWKRLKESVILRGRV